MSLLVAVLVVLVVFAAIVGLLLASGFRPQKHRSGRSRNRVDGGNKGGTGI